MKIRYYLFPTNLLITIQSFFVLLLTCCIIATLADSIVIKDEGRTNMETLEMVHVVMRHGQRNPINNYPLDPYKDERIYWKEGWGSLTKTGLSQTFELGQFIRQRYDGFIDRVYKQDEISVISSDSSRTIRSCLSALRGMYPCVNDVENNCSITSQSQIVPIRTIPSQMDNLLMFSQDCPKYKKEFKKLLKESKENQKYEKNWLPIINNGTGLKAAMLTDAIIAMDNIDAQTHHHNRTLPKWATPETVKFMQSYLLYWLKSEVGNEKLKRFRSHLIQKIISNAHLKSDGKMKTKMIFYSAHDRTIIALHQILNVDMKQRPPHSSALLFELHRTPKYEDYNIEIFYRNTTEEKPFKLEIPICKSPCRLSQLKKNLKPLYYINYEEECEIPTLCSSSHSTSSKIMNIVIIISSLVLLQ